MNPQELKASLQHFYDNRDEIGIAVYAFLKDVDAQRIRKIDIEADAANGLKDLFLQSLRDRIMDCEDLSVLNLSTSDQRCDAVYVYDIEQPEEFKCLRRVLETDDFPLLDLMDSGLSRIKALIIEIGNNAGQVVLYKTLAPVNVFGRASFFLKKSRHRLERISDEFLRVSAGFQLMSINDQLFVVDLEAIEKGFGFYDVIRREAINGINSIESMGLVANPDVLHELLDDVKYARRFTRVSRSSPVIMAGVPNAIIVEFCKTFPSLVGRIRFDDAEDKIILDTKVSKDLLIKLLMDDYLTSGLTRFHYESVAKDSVAQEQ